MNNYSQQKIWTVIPTHNRRQMTGDCLKSLREQDSCGFEIIVVDDGSNDGTSAMIAKEFPKVILLKGDGNLWWTGAVNRGIAHALENCQLDDFILLLNDDLILPKNYIAQVLKLAEAYPRALIGSVVLNIEDQETIYSGGVKIDWLTARWRDVNEGRKLSEFPAGYTQNVSTLTGRGVLIPTAVFRDIGLYNEKHYKQGGDPELPCRARKKGYDLIVIYDAIVYSHTRD